MSGLTRTFRELPNWTFSIDEISPGVFRVRGVGGDARTTEATGTDPDTLLEDCRRFAEGTPPVKPERRRHT
jgi:hypothetical protein